MILTPLQKLPNNVGNVGKIIVATGFEWLPKVQKIAQSGHTTTQAHSFSLYHSLYHLLFLSLLNPSLSFSFRVTLHFISSEIGVSRYIGWMDAAKPGKCHSSV